MTKIEQNDAVNLLRDIQRDLFIMAIVIVAWGLSPFLQHILPTSDVSDLSRAAIALLVAGLLVSRSRKCEKTANRLYMTTIEDN